MKNALILHGSGNNSKGNWYPWLKEELEDKGFRVWVPDLPNADYPDIYEWTDFIFSKDWEFNQDSVLIGHSAGVPLVFAILQNLPVDVKADKAILVAGFTRLGTLEDENKIKQGLLKQPFNWKKIKKSANKFYFIHSDNDRYECGLEEGQIMQKHLGGELIIKPDEDHFSVGTMGEKYREFPELLEYI